jgi:hypothetical protein
MLDVKLVKITLMSRDYIFFTLFKNQSCYKEYSGTTNTHFETTVIATLRLH